MLLNKEEIEYIFVALKLTLNHAKKTVQNWTAPKKVECKKTHSTFFVSWIY